MLKLETNAYYRNKTEVNADTVTIDEGALWQYNGTAMVLVDDDQHMAVLIPDFSETFVPENN